MWDLDDTLILERDYVRSGFRAVAESVALTAAIDVEEVSDFLWTGFESGVRGDAFNRVRNRFPELKRFPVLQMVDTYRSHSPDINVPPEALAIMARIRQQNRNQAAITDGPLAGQQSKAMAINLSNLVDLIIFTDEWGREYWKPNERAFLKVQHQFDADPSECVYIGDNPSKDFVSPTALGWGSIRMRRHGQLHVNSEDGTPAKLEASDWFELAELLGAAN